MSVLQVAGKTSNGLAKGIAVESDGRLITTKTWELEDITVLESGSITTTDAVNNLSNPTDLSGYGIISLRIVYNMDVDTKIDFFTDLTSGSSTGLYDKDGNRISITLPATDSAKPLVITPEDLPCLPYIKLLQLRAKATETPTNTGYVNIHAIVKR